jgi:hypothetical protein
MRPTLLHGCARAATGAEARFRIDAPIADLDATRVIALDPGAAGIIQRMVGRHRGGTRFFRYEGRARRVNGDGPQGVALRTADGAGAWLAEELTGAHVVVMIATADDGAEGASTIGAACTLRGIMTAGLVLGQGREVGRAVSALRPHARVLMVTTDEHDVSELLAALRS